MSQEKRERKEWEDDAEEIREIFGTLSRELPALIKAIMGSVFSEEAGRDMGKAAAAFYKELKEAGMSEDTAVKMTENYMSVFSSLKDVMKGSMNGRGEFRGEEIGEEIRKTLKRELHEKHRERDEEDED
ncbi:MAG: hypothetical protein QHH24_03290 [Candidatus Bathyarchaeota archaeon]|nr:hypothetical protein [Candidatus Bathyarchaeota archaeon]